MSASSSEITGVSIDTITASEIVVVSSGKTLVEVVVVDTGAKAVVATTVTFGVVVVTFIGTVVKEVADACLTDVDPDQFPYTNTENVTATTLTFRIVVARNFHSPIVRILLADNLRKAEKRLV